MPEHAAGREHCQFRIRRGAGGGAEDGYILALSGIHQSVIKIRLARRAVTAQARKLVGFHQTRVIVFPHPARIGVNDVLQIWHAIGERQQLVDLFLVLGEY